MRAYPMSATPSIPTTNATPTGAFNQPNKAPAKKLATLKSLWPFLKPYQSRVWLAFVLLCLGSATLLLVPLAFRDLIDFGFITNTTQTTQHNGLIGALSLNGHF